MWWHDSATTAIQHALTRRLPFIAYIVPTDTYQTPQFLSDWLERNASKVVAVKMVKESQDGALFLQLFPGLYQNTEDDNEEKRGLMCVIRDGSVFVTCFDNDEAFDQKLRTVVSDQPPNIPETPAGNEQAPVNENQSAQPPVPDSKMKHDEKNGSNTAVERQLKQRSELLAAQETLKKRTKTKPKPTVQPVEEKPSRVERIYTQSQVAVRLPDGTTIRQPFDVTRSIKSVYEWVRREGDIQGAFRLCSVFPKQRLEEDEATVKEKELVPSAVLVVEMLNEIDEKPSGGFFMWLVLIWQWIFGLFAKKELKEKKEEHEIKAVEYQQKDEASPRIHTLRQRHESAEDGSSDEARYNGNSTNQL